MHSRAMSASKIFHLIGRTLASKGNEIHLPVVDDDDNGALLQQNDLSVSICTADRRCLGNIALAAGETDLAHRCHSCRGTYV